MTINAGIGMMGLGERKSRGLVFRSPRARINPMRETVSSVVDAEMRCAEVAGFKGRIPSDFGLGSLVTNTSKEESSQ